MKWVRVNASRAYDVGIGPGLLNRLGPEIAARLRPQKICLVTDSRVAPLYAARAVESWTPVAETVTYTIPAGEASKNGQEYLSLLSFLAGEKLTRSDCLVALGGGVVGDLTGFAAATYLRGIAYAQVPTTLLAAVDSSVGGKTAIDLPEGKNLAGAFYQPSLVLCDTDTLNTLPEVVFRDGCAEVIKYGVLYDPALFAHLEEKGLGFDREAVIARCVELKRDVVAQDEFDRGQRQKLNLGHTVGHGVEARSGFTISHGKAVAIGMAIVSRAAAKMGLCQTADRDRILAVLERFSLPVSTAIPPEELAKAALSDKKRAGDTVNLILPAAIGDCRIVPTPVAQLEGFLKAGM